MFGFDSCSGFGAESCLCSPLLDFSVLEGGEKGDGQKAKGGQKEI